MSDKGYSLRERAEWAVMGPILWVLGRLPFRWRVPVAGWLMARVAAPLGRSARKIGSNLDYACPELSEDVRDEVIRNVPRNVGRMFIELFSPELSDLAARTPLEGPGVAAIEAARTTGQPVILVSGHFGNYDVFRAGLIARGFDMAALYRPMQNRLFNRFYERAVRRTGEKMFPQGRAGVTDMVRHLQSGGVLGILTDHHYAKGEELTFFGKPAMTSVSPAKMALRYNALLVPIYAIRQPDGRSFRIVVEAPVPHSDERTMTQALNDSLEAQIRAHMAQWFWTFSRWKVRRDPAPE